jgi:hypothetical protein
VNGLMQRALVERQPGDGIADVAGSDDVEVVGAIAWHHRRQPTMIDAECSMHRVDLRNVA